MKISKVETLCLSRPHELDRQWVTAQYRTIKADCAIVVIHTDEGLTGIGEASAYGWPLLIKEWVEWLSPQLVGKDPADPTIAPHPNGRGRPHDGAVAGIDCALWDLRGQIAGKPTAQLLNPNAQDRVRPYASSGCRYDWRKDPNQLIREALDYVEQGWTAMKFRIGTRWEWDGVTVDRFLGLVRELAQAVDGRMQLMLDGNCRLTYDQSLTIAKELDRLGFTWFEEPMPRDVDDYARLNRAVDLPITGGEPFTTLEEFRPWIEKRAVDIVQQDAGLVGISECMRIAEMAYDAGIDTCPHSWHNGLMCMAHAHFVAALPTAHRPPSRPEWAANVVELCLIQGPLQWAILADPPPIVDGHMALPQKPGLGVHLAPNLEESFPYIEGHYAITVER